MDLSEMAGRSGFGLRGEPPRLLAPLAQLGAEVACALSSALDRVMDLQAAGSIAPQGLSALRSEIERARRAGIMGQQVVRMASGHLALTQEPLDIGALVQEALRQHTADFQAQGLATRATVAAAEIMGDATLLFALLRTMLDWCLEHARSDIELSLQVLGAPPQARLTVGYCHQAAGGAGALPVARPPGQQTRLDTMTWQLLHQTAQLLALPLVRQDTGARTELRIDFPQTLTSSPEYQALMGHHVVVLCARREVRKLVNDALRNLGLMTDFVSSVDQARSLCSEHLPHALIYESTLAGDHFERLCAQLSAASPRLAFIRLAEQGKALDMLKEHGRSMASVGRDAIAQALPSALLLTLPRPS